MRGRKSAGLSCAAKCMPASRCAAGSRPWSGGFREFPGYGDARVGSAMDRSRERVSHRSGDHARSATLQVEHLLVGKLRPLLDELEAHFRLVAHEALDRAL